MKSLAKNIYDALGRHPVHPFPARMAPGVALEVLNNCDKSIRVLDPMMGSGTVVALARSQGHTALGVDIDPLAVLISEVWTSALDKRSFVSEAIHVLDNAKKYAASLDSSSSFPPECDLETKEFLRYWFDFKSRRQLTALVHSIERVEDLSLRRALWCSFSRLIITKQGGVSLAMDLSHSRPHKVYEVAPTRPFEEFLRAVNRVAENTVGINERGRGPRPHLRQGDARNLPLGPASVDLIVTSPPYLNAIDYMRCSKFSLVWMGHNVKSIRDLRNRSIGTEAGMLTADSRIMEGFDSLRLSPEFPRREKAIVLSYIRDMSAMISECKRVLSRCGTATFVVGENTIRGSFVRNSDLVIHLAKSAGLRMLTKKARILPANRRYLPPPTNSFGSMDNRMRKEVILSFAHGM